MKADGTNEKKNNKIYNNTKKDSYLHIWETTTGDVWLDLLWVLNRDVSW